MERGKQDRLRVIQVCVVAGTLHDDHAGIRYSFFKNRYLVTSDVTIVVSPEDQRWDVHPMQTILQVMRYGPDKGLPHDSVQAAIVG